MQTRLWTLVLLFSLIFSGCSTLKTWFTAQGQKLGQAQQLADQGQSLGASALAVEALTLEPDYKEARALLEKHFSAGQDQFRADESRWLLSAAPDRWDQLHRLYLWQASLARGGVAISPAFRVEPVDEPLAVAARGAAVYHLSLAEELLAFPGPRQARKALAEGRVAARFDAAAPGLSAWLEVAREAAGQKLLVVPFFFEGLASWPPVSGPLASLISRDLMEGELPELTSVFPSDRLVSVPGAGLARIGLVTQPDALALAAEAGQNLVLLGQLTRVAYQEPKLTVKTFVREKKALIVDPDHPQGQEKLWQATLTTRTWVTSLGLTASFSVIEGPTGRDLITAIRESKVGDEAVETLFIGDREALLSDDLVALAVKPDLANRDELLSQALRDLAQQVSAVVKDALR